MAWHRSLPRLLLVLLLVFTAGLPAGAEQCPACRQQSHTKDIGACRLCGEMTLSGQFQLCMDCSDRFQECERCRLALPTKALKLDERPEQTYQAGRWTYRFSISNQGSRSEGYWGTLAFAGQALPEPGTVNDHVRTPWGLIYWVGKPITAFGEHGWMLRPRPSQPIGRLLGTPGLPSALVVQVKVLQADRRLPVAEDWILKELAKLGVTEKVGVQGDWCALASASLKIHDSKHYGQAALALRDPGPSQPLLVEILGSSHATVPLLRQVGERRVVKHTISSSIASLDFYLAFQVLASPAGKP